MPNCIIGPVFSTMASPSVRWDTTQLFKQVSFISRDREVEWGRIQANLGRSVRCDIWCFRENTWVSKPLDDCFSKCGPWFIRRNLLASSLQPQNPCPRPGNLHCDKLLDVFSAHCNLKALLEEVGPRNQKEWEVSNNTSPAEATYFASVEVLDDGQVEKLLPLPLRLHGVCQELPQGPVRPFQ